MAKTPKLTAEVIRLYFEMLGNVLTDLGIGPEQEIRALIIGGAFMLLKVGNREMTEDIDAWLLNIPEITSVEGKTHPLSQALKTAINTVASRLEINRHWFNDDVTSFAGEYLVPGEMTLYGTYGPLSIYMPSDACMLAVKLMVYRKKDLRDVQALLERTGVKTREQAQATLDKYVPDRRWQDHYVVQETLDELF